MSNQLLFWLLFVIPWLTLFFMKKEDIKRFFPVAILAALTSVIIHELGLSFGWWKDLETVYPLKMSPVLIGLNPVLTMWIFKFTYKKFWWYIVVEIVSNIGFDFWFLSRFIPARGMGEFYISPFLAFGITMIHGLILYLYQIWQEEIYIHPYKENGK
jgi:hypothetical protein